MRGGDSLYLNHWMRKSGLADLFPSLRDTVYLGVSGGSMVTAPHVGEEFLNWKPPTGDDDALGMVNFAFFPHLDHPDHPDLSIARAEPWAAGLPVPVPGYAIDNQTAISIRPGNVSAVSSHLRRVRIGAGRRTNPNASPVAEHECRCLLSFVPSH